MGDSKNEDEAAFFDGKEPPPPPRRPIVVARTMEVIAQAKVAEVRSPKRIAIYVGGGLVTALVLLFALSRLGVGPFELSSSEGDGTHVFNGASSDQSFFDRLLGKPKPKPVAAPRSSESLVRPQAPLVKKEQQHLEKLGEADKAALAQLYAHQDLTAPAPTVHGSGPSAAIDRSDAPLSPDQVAKTIANYQAGYVSCIDRELKRNPSFRGGKIRIVTTLMTSGIVGGAHITSDNAALARTVAGSSLGECLIGQTRRMVFPSFAGDPFDVEIPLVVGGSL